MCGVCCRYPMLIASGLLLLTCCCNNLNDRIQIRDRVRKQSVAATISTTTCWQTASTRVNHKQLALRPDQIVLTRSSQPIVKQTLIQNRAPRGNCNRQLRNKYINYIDSIILKVESDQSCSSFRALLQYSIDSWISDAIRF